MFGPGKDATEAFEDVGHSDEARALLTDMFVGEFEKNGVCLYLSFPLSPRLTPFCRSSRSSPQPSTPLPNQLQ